MVRKNTIPRLRLLIIVAVTTVAIGASLVLVLWSSQSRHNQETQTSQQQISSSATLTGVVTKSPTSPGPQPAGGADVPSPVANHTIEARDADGVTVSSTTTDANGRYTMQLTPGRYTLFLKPQVGVGIIKNNVVNVTSGESTLDVVADTGLR